MTPDVPGVDFRMIPDFPGYCIGSDGSVWSCWTVNKDARGVLQPSTMGQQWKLLKCFKAGDGYRAIGLHRGGVQVKRYVHRLVLIAFIGNPDDARMQAAHGNGIKSDNRLSNLRWATVTENHSDKILHGTSTIGERNPQSKVTSQQVKQIRSMYESGVGARELGIRFGLKTASVYQIVNRKRWVHI